MTGIQTACYCLVASAFLLAGLLVYSLGGHQIEPEADARMVIARESFSLMTAKTREGEEALWVLDNRSARVLIYRLSLAGAGRGRLELAGNIDLTSRTLFGGGGGGGAGGR